jgi:hypothetical protein
VTEKVGGWFEAAAPSLLGRRTSFILCQDVLLNIYLKV